MLVLKIVSVTISKLMAMNPFWKRFFMLPVFGMVKVFVKLIQSIYIRPEIARRLIDS